MNASARLPVIDLTSDDAAAVAPHRVLEGPLQPAPNTSSTQGAAPSSSSSSSSSSSAAAAAAAAEAVLDISEHAAAAEDVRTALPQDHNSFTERRNDAPGARDDSEDLGEEEGAEAWDSNSVIDDIVHSMTSDEEDEPDGAGTPKDRESLEEMSRRIELVKLLHKLGPHQFVYQLLESDQYTPKRLCEALGGRVGLDFEDVPEDHAIYYRALGKIMSREITRRLKIESYNTVEDAVDLLKKSKNVLVLTGAGISTSLGIPDFRSKNGLYNMLRDSPLAEFVDDPQDVFALDVFLENPAIFFTVARSILSPAQKFSPTHSFIRLLQDNGQLLTNYTQNIDNFEAWAGIDPNKLVHCHGSFATATCIRCHHRVPGSEIESEISAGQIPRCRACLEKLALRRLSAGASGMKRKRSYNDQAKSSKNKKREDWEDSSDEESEEDLSDEAAGVMKPDIVFFGEDLPRDFHDRLSNCDRDKVDLVIVIGTSLMVAPVSEVPGFMPCNIPQIYISREPCRHINFDIELLGDCDLVVAELCRRAGWQLKHDMIPPNEIVDVRPEYGFAHRHRFRSESELKTELEADEQSQSVITSNGDTLEALEEDGNRVAEHGIKSGSVDTEDTLTF